MKNFVVFVVVGDDECEFSIPEGLYVVVAVHGQLHGVGTGAGGEGVRGRRLYNTSTYKPAQFEARLTQSPLH